MNSLFERWTNTSNEMLCVERDGSHGPFRFTVFNADTGVINYTFSLEAFRARELAERLRELAERLHELANGNA